MASSALDSAAAQSIGLPSRTAPARSGTSPLLTATFHFLRQPHERPLSRFARGVGRRLAKCFGELLVAVAHLDPGNDGLPLLRLQPLERALVPIHRLVPNRLLERRLGAIGLETIEIGDLGPSSLAAELVANAIENRLPQIRLKRTDTAGLETFDPLKRLDEGVLDKVVGVGQIARPPGQSPAGPALERFEMAGEEPIQCLAVPGTRAVDEMKGRFWIAATRGARVCRLRDARSSDIGIPFRESAHPTRPKTRLLESASRVELCSEAPAPGAPGVIVRISAARR